MPRASLLQSLIGPQLSYTEPIQVSFLLWPKSLLNNLESSIFLGISRAQLKVPCESALAYRLSARDCDW